MVFAKCIHGCKKPSSTSSHTIVLMPEIVRASFALKRCPSHFSFSSLGLVNIKTSLYFGSGLSGNNTSIVSSCSMPVSHTRSAFCLNLCSASPLAGSSSLLLKIAIAALSIFSTKRLRFCINSSALRGRYFMNNYLEIAIYFLNTA